MLDLDPLNLVFLAFFVGLCLLDAVYRARKFPTARLWKTKGILFFFFGFYLTIYAPYLWDGFFGSYRLIDATALPKVLAVPIGLLLYELGIYLWHRASHRFQSMWRWSHQLHHSAERIDVYGAFYFHPIDILGFALVGSFTLVMVFGVHPDVAATIGFITNLLAVVQHANIKTPRWLGWFIMRPEAHNLHHQRGVHFKNFGDIPHWDMVFGTYENPQTWDAPAGFFDGSSERLADMLRGKDISAETGRERSDLDIANHNAPRR